MFLLISLAHAAPEWCDGIDNDGDGHVDEGPHLVFVDSDGDGHGDPQSYTVVDADCTADLPGPDDCDDSDPHRSPSADETCNGIDDDCDQNVDGGLIVCGACLDFEHGDSRYLRCGGFAPLDWDDAQGACEDDGYALAVPDDAVEFEFLLHNTSITDRWLGLYRAQGSVWTWDDQPAPYVQYAPTQPNHGPGSCLRIRYDSGADTALDDMWDHPCNVSHGYWCETTCTQRTWYQDGDGDGQGDSHAAVQACRAPVHHVALPGDCDDLNAEVHESASEICDGEDNDCDGATDEDGDPTTYYDDTDGDGAGDPTITQELCGPAPPGFVNLPNDCDPSNGLIAPGIDEVCNGFDDDCDGHTDDDDDSLTGAPTWYADVDGDGAGDEEESLQACLPPAHFVSDHSDCDDADPHVGTPSVEVCDGLDNDCNGHIDDDAVDELTGYLDHDGDGFGAGDPIHGCELPPGYVLHPGDCEDHDANIHPGATEVCDEVDNDCNTLIDEAGGTVSYADVDGDGFGDPASADEACAQPEDNVDDGTDCDDTAPLVFPGADEVCNTVDDDCNGLIDAADPGLLDGLALFVDDDGDGFGDPGAPVVQCSDEGAAANDRDCDDGDAGRNPGLEDVGDDGIDQDCDGADAEWIYGNGAGCTCDGSRQSAWFLRRR